jgi:hypothetical protein
MEATVIFEVELFRPLVPLTSNVEPLRAGCAAGPARNPVTDDADRLSTGFVVISEVGKGNPV